MISESRGLRLDSEFSENFITSLALRYNLPSEFTSLLLLHSASQFLEHSLDPPSGHPEYQAWVELKEVQGRSEEVRAMERETGRLDKIKKIFFLSERALSQWQTPKGKKIHIFFFSEEAGRLDKICFFCF
jgi:hypothetical protein